MPKIKNGMRNRQNGGTKTSTLTVFSQNDQTWVSTDNDRDISRLILLNSKSLKVVSSGSLCSMILKCSLIPDGNIKIRSQIYHQDGSLLTPETRADRPRFVDVGKEHAHVCMKISLVTTPSNSTVTRVEWDETSTRKIRKVVTTVEEANKELEEQMRIHKQLLCGENASDIMPDGIAACVLTPHDFSIYVTAIKTKSPERFDDKTQRVIDWIINSATTNSYNIHIAFMDFLEGFDTLSNFFRNNPNPDIQRSISYKMAAVILMLLLKTVSASYDLHSGNGMTDGTNSKAVDYGRIYCFDDSPSKYELEEYCSNLWEDQEYDDELEHFFNIDNIEEKSSLLKVFETYYQKLLIKFPKDKFKFSKLDKVEQRKYIYESLIFIVFIDGITKKIKYEREGFQCSDIMSRVFHNEAAFESLDKFLMYFKLDYNLFLTELTTNQPSYIAELNNVLDTISAFLEPMLIPCQLVTRSKGSAFGYAADSVERPVSASASLVPFGHGGKKRRHTQKKYKIRRYYYSRNKHKRISYRSRKT
jgi:hypothetical protein